MHIIDNTIIMIIIYGHKWILINLMVTHILPAAVLKYLQ